MGAWTCKHVCIGTDFAGANDTWQRTLTEAVTLWKIFLVIVSIVIMVILIRRCGILVTVKISWKTKKESRSMENHFWNSCSGVILLQAWIPYHYQHIDDDDARYVSEEVSAVVHDTLLVDDPITDEYMYWDVGK